MDAGDGSDLPRSSVAANSARGQTHHVTLDDLPELRALTLRTALRAGLSEDRARGLVLAVNEIISNALVHGTPPVRLAFTRTSQHLQVTVTDQGPARHPNGQQPPDPATPATPLSPPARRPEVDQLRGRGLWLASRLCDQVQVRTETGRTIVELHITHR